MNKLYAVKLKSTYSQVAGGVVDAGHHTALSQYRVANLILKQGIGRVETIRHDDKMPRNTHQLNGNEMLELWQAVERKQNQISGDNSL